MRRTVCVFTNDLHTTYVEFPPEEIAFARVRFDDSINRFTHIENVSLFLTILP